MADFLIVDGYNILHAWEGFKQTLAEDLDHARVRLIDALVNYCAVTGVRVIVVFDAHMVKGGTGSREEISGVEVIYTSEGETADMVIEKLAGRLADEDRVTVATSDWAQQRIVFGKGAVRMSAKEFEKEVMAKHKELHAHFNPEYHYDRKLYRHLNDNIREILERIRRQK